jgi:hypothetical protein
VNRFRRCLDRTASDLFAFGCRTVAAPSRPTSDLRVARRQMTLAALAGDRRIGMVTVLPARIASTRGGRATYFDRRRGNHRRWRLLPVGMCNIVLYGTKRSLIRCERPPTTTRLYRIAECELLKEAHDSGNSRNSRCGAPMWWICPVS